jgi:hypothetical protein
MSRESLARAIRSARIAAAFQRARQTAEQQRQTETHRPAPTDDDTEHPYAAVLRSAGKYGVAGSCCRPT